MSAQPTTERAPGCFEYVLQLIRKDGTVVEQAPMHIDWGPAEEWARLETVRRGSGKTSTVPWGGGVHPIWHDQRGEPYLGGFRILPQSEAQSGEGELLPVEESDPPAVEFSIDYLEVQIEARVAHLREKGRLSADEAVDYTLCAFSSDRTPTAGSAEGGAVAVSSYRFREGDLQAWEDGSSSEGETDEDVVPAFLPRSVVEEAQGLAEAAGDRETGGIFIGHLHRDSGRARVFLEVTAQIPFQETVADEASLQLTADTWTHARAAIRLRNLDESVLGWWHSHPVFKWCGKCPDQKRAVCPLGGSFFSAQDRSLHRTVFCRAESLAMVVNQIRPQESTVSMFGWRRGIIAPRGFYFMDGKEQRS